MDVLKCQRVSKSCVTFLSVWCSLRNTFLPESLGAPFRRCADGVPEWFETNVRPHRLATADDRVAVAVEEAVYVSQDGGRTWKVAATGLPAVRAVAVT